MTDMEPCELCGVVDDDGYTRIGCGCSEIERACSNCQMLAHYAAAKLDSEMVMRDVVVPHMRTRRIWGGKNLVEALMSQCSVDKATAYAKLQQMESIEGLLQHGSSARWAWPISKEK